MKSLKWHMKRHIYTEEGQSISATLRELNVLKPLCESYYIKKGKPFLYNLCLCVCLFVSNKRQNVVNFFNVENPRKFMKSRNIFTIEIKDWHVAP